MIYRLTLEEATAAAVAKGFESYTVIKGIRSYKVIEGIHDHPIGGTLVYQFGTKDKPQKAEIRQVDKLYITEGEMMANTLMSLDKPIGITPGNIIYELRIMELQSAIDRYELANMPYPIIWRYELLQVKGLLALLQAIQTPEAIVNPIPPSDPISPAAEITPAIEPVIAAEPSPITATETDEESKKARQKVYKDRWREKNKNRIAQAQSEESIIGPPALKRTSPQSQPTLATNNVIEEDEDYTEAEALELEPMEDIDDKDFKPQPTLAKRDTKPVIKVDEANPDDYVAVPSPVFRKTDDNHPLLRNLSPEIRAKTHVVPKLSKEEMALAIARAKQISRK